MSFWCRLDIHDWAYRGPYCPGPSHRVCIRCLKEQDRDAYRWKSPDEILARERAEADAWNAVGRE